MTLVVTPALRDMRNQAVLLTALAASGIAWWLLLAVPPMAQMFVCGVDGLGPVDGAWNVGRLVALTGMWLVMALAMMLPAGALSLGWPRDRGRDLSEVSSLTLSHRGRIVASAAIPPSVLPDISPSRGEIGQRHEPRLKYLPNTEFRLVVFGRAEGGASCVWAAFLSKIACGKEGHLLGYLLFLVGISIAAAITQWMLESVGVLGEGSRIGSPLLMGLLLAAVGACHVMPLSRGKPMPCGGPARQGGSGLAAGWRHGRASLGCCLTMVGLQFAGGVMNVGLMIGLTIWMLLEAALPWKRDLAASTGIALMTAGCLTIASAIA